MVTPIERAVVQTTLNAGGIKLLDAQGPGLFERAHLAGAIRGSVEDVAGVLDALGDDLDTEIVVYCTNLRCTGSAYAAEQLEAVGYRNVHRYAGGLQDWVDAGLAVTELDS